MRPILTSLTAIIALSCASCSGAGVAQEGTGAELNSHTAAPTPIPNISQNPLTPRSADGWHMVWGDEFSGTEIDRSKWDFDIDCWGGGNEERQCYTDRPKNAAVKEGALVITAQKENYTGPAFPPYLRDNAQKQRATTSKPFTSARMVTRGKASWTYGWIEVRAKLPQGQGTWPAIWMLPEQNSYGTWAASGEIDILEAVNLGVDCVKCPGGKENTILGTLHFGKEWPDNSLSSSEVALPGSIEDFHTYGLIWREGEFIWLVDGQVYARKTAEDWWSGGSDDVNAPFNRPFHLILNLAIGGGLAEDRGLGGVSRKNFPKQMIVDYVRIYQCGEAAKSEAEQPDENRDTMSAHKNSDGGQSQIAACSTRGGG